MTVRVVLQTPMPPNFIRTAAGDVIPVEDLEDVMLRALAKRWTDLLLLIARQRREAKAQR